MRKLLSICIPTFNRKDYLDRLLANIEKQLDTYRLHDKVEVLVSDNCSEDATMSVVEKYNSFVKYQRNEVNIGPDANFLSLFGLAQGEYIWLPGDDDEFRTDTVNFIVKEIERTHFDFLYLRTAGPVAEDAQRQSQQLSNIELLKKVNIFTTFMTSQVIRADLIKEQVEAARVHLGSFMAYYKIFLEALWRSKKCYISHGKEISANDDNTGNYLFYKVWGQSVFDVLTASPFGTNSQLISLMKVRMFFSLLLPITFKLRQGNKGFYFLAENPQESMSKYFNSGFFKVVFSLYTKAPIAILLPLHKVMQITSKVHKKLIGGIV